MNGYDGSGNGETMLHPAEITRLLNAADDQHDALDQVFVMVYDELKPIARNLLARSRHQTLSPTVVVHEAYAKLIGTESLSISGRRHFFALCARTMRQIVVDYARSQLADKRGAGARAVELTDEGVIDFDNPESQLAMDQALKWLEARDPRLVELIHLRVYVGLDLAEIGELLEVTPRQLQRDWQRARAWLGEALLQGEG